VTFEQSTEVPWRLGIGIVNEHSELLNTRRYFTEVEKYLKLIENGISGLSSNSEPCPGLLKSVLTDPNCEIGLKNEFKIFIDSILESYPSSSAIKIKMANILNTTDDDLLK